MFLRLSGEHVRGAKNCSADDGAAAFRHGFKILKLFSLCDDRRRGALARCADHVVCMRVCVVYARILDQVGNSFVASFGDA